MNTRANDVVFIRSERNQTAYSVHGDGEGEGADCRNQNVKFHQTRIAVGRKTRILNNAISNTIKRNTKRIETHQERFSVGPNELESERLCHVDKCVLGRHVELEREVPHDRGHQTSAEQQRHETVFHATYTTNTSEYRYTERETDLSASRFAARPAAPGSFRPGQTQPRRCKQ